MGARCRLPGEARCCHRSRTRTGSLAREWGDGPRTKWPASITQGKNACAADRRPTSHAPTQVYRSRRSMPPAWMSAVLPPQNGMQLVTDGAAVDTRENRLTVAPVLSPPFLSRVVGVTPRRCESEDLAPLIGQRTGSGTRAIKQPFDQAGSGDGARKHLRAGAEAGTTRGQHCPRCLWHGRKFAAGAIQGADLSASPWRQSCCWWSRRYAEARRLYHSSIGSLISEKQCACYDSKYLS